MRFTLFGIVQLTLDPSVSSELLSHGRAACLQAHFLFKGPVVRAPPPEWFASCFSSHSASLLWLAWFQVKAFETTYKVGDLIEGEEYLFGVAAENEVGLSKIMETEMLIKASKPLGRLSCGSCTFPPVLRRWNDGIRGGGHEALSSFISLSLSLFLSLSLSLSFFWPVFVCIKIHWFEAWYWSCLRFMCEINNVRIIAHFLVIITIIIQESYKTSTLWLKALNSANRQKHIQLNKDCRHCYFASSVFVSISFFLYFSHRKTVRARGPSGSCGSHTQQSDPFLGRQPVRRLLPHPALRPGTSWRLENLLD